MLRLLVNQTVVRQDWCIHAVYDAAKYWNLSALTNSSTCHCGFVLRGVFTENDRFYFSVNNRVSNTSVAASSRLMSFIVLMQFVCS